jgi:hypothetical protein
MADLWQGISMHSECNIKEWHTMGCHDKSWEVVGYWWV